MAQSILKRSIANPIARKELRSRMRGRRAYVTLTAYLVGMAGIILLIYGSYTAQNYGYNSNTRDVGKVVFFTIVAVQIFLAAFIGPAFTSGTISGEKERQTYDLLRTTLLPARKLVSGKLVSSLSYVLLLVAASLPLHGIALLLGGVDVVEFAVSQLLIVVSAITFALWGMYISTLMRSTLASTVVAYAGTLFMLLALPFVFMIGQSLVSDILYSGGVVRPNTTQLILYGIGFALSATNLIMTISVSEGWYLDYDAIFFFERSMGGGMTVTLPSLWWVYTIVYALLSLFLYWLCIRRVQRIARK